MSELPRNVVLLCIQVEDVRWYLQKSNPSGTVDNFMYPRMAGDIRLCKVPGFTPHDQVSMHYLITF